jgi:hypothetical protein
MTKWKWTWLKDRFQEEKLYAMEGGDVIYFRQSYPPELYVMKNIDPTWTPHVPSEYDVRAAVRTIFGEPG